ncbi:MAG TPA: hypothetical protein VGB37_12750 [Candidatus Lokiarchaeia archaeon]
MGIIFKDVTNNKEITYNVMVKFDDETRTLIHFNCYCRFMSFDFWSKRFQKFGTLCRHILQVCAEENIELPERYKTERNLKLINKFKEEK